MIDIKAIEEILKNNKSFVLTCHENPDGDALGAVNALALVLEKLEKTVSVIYPEEIPRKYYFLPRASHWMVVNDINDENFFCDVFVVMDASTQKRVAEIWEIVEWNQVMNIDHHPTNTLFGDYNIIDNKASSTCELLYEIFRELELPIDRNIATNLYTGIFTDTGSFNYENTTKRTFCAAKYLIEYDIHPHIIAQEIYESVPLNLFYFIREVLQGLKLSPDKKIAWLTCSRETIKKYQINDSELEGLINYAKMLQPVEFAVLFKETEDGNTKVAFRAKTEDVSKVAVALGGGGHVRAAGCYLEYNLATAETFVIDKLQQELVKNELDDDWRESGPSQ